MEEEIENKEKENLSNGIEFPGENFTFVLIEWETDGPQLEILIEIKKVFPEYKVILVLCIVTPISDRILGEIASQ